MSDFASIISANKVVFVSALLGLFANLFLNVSLGLEIALWVFLMISGLNILFASIKK